MRFRNGVARFYQQARGQNLIEYAVLCSLIALVLSGAALGLGTNIDNWYGRMASVVNGLRNGDASGECGTPQCGASGPHGSQGESNPDGIGGGTGSGNGNGRGRGGEKGKAR